MVLVCMFGSRDVVHREVRRYVVVREYRNVLEVVKSRILVNSGHRRRSEHGYPE